MTSQSRKKRQTTARKTRTASNLDARQKRWRVIRDDRTFLVRVILFACLLCAIAGFGNSSTGQDYRRRSRIVIRNVREAGIPPKKATTIRTAPTIRHLNQPESRRPQILRTSQQEWSARKNGKRAPKRKRSSVRTAQFQRRGAAGGLSDEGSVTYRMPNNGRASNANKPLPHNQQPRLRPIPQSRTQRISDARPAFEDRPSPARGTNQGPLKWRRPDEPREAKVTRTTARPAHWSPQTRQQQSGVRQAAHLAPLDPFDDPFGDKQAQHAEPLPEPNRTQHSVMQRQSPQSSGSSNRIITTDGNDAPPSPLYQTGTGGKQANPAPQSIKRDCAAELAKCRSIERNPISSISLDITPSLRSSTVRGRDAAAQRQLQQARARTWKNRAGDVVAEGKLTNLEYGRAVITDSDGVVRRVPVNHLSDADLCVVATLWNLPAECILDEDPYVPRKWLASTMTWKASALCHRPLYFEQVQLERYGHTAGPILQPVFSGAHFFTSLAALPYKMGINPPTECYYPLGYYRPGNCAPWLIPPIPLSLRGALWEAGVVTGGAALLP